MHLFLLMLKSHQMIIKEYSKAYTLKDKQNGKETTVNKKCCQSLETKKWLEAEQTVEWYSSVDTSMTLLVIYRQGPFSAHALLVVKYFFHGHPWMEE